MTLSAGDALFAWAAGGRESVGWACDKALGVFGADLSTRDRLVVRGDAEAVSVLADHVLAQHHIGVRVNGDAAVINALGGIRPDLVVSEEFGWMQVTAGQLRRPGPSASDPAEWLPADAEAEVAALLEDNFPASEAKPGGTGVRRWAGIRQNGVLVATACEAWSAPTVGFMAGVATTSSARGRGLARTLCAAVLDQLIAEHGRAALMVDLWNTAAIRLYEGLGMTMRPIRSARHHSVPSKATPVRG